MELLSEDEEYVTAEAEDLADFVEGKKSFNSCLKSRSHGIFPFHFDSMWSGSIVD